MHANNGNRNHRAAFTLIELLVVIAIIALLVSILIPTLKAAKDAARRAVCMTHLKNIAYAVNMYVNDNLDVMPPWTAMFAGSPQRYAQQWPDFLIGYFDSTAKSIPSELRPSMPHWTADAYHVANQTPPGGSNWFVNHQSLGIVYSPGMNCPSQPVRNAGKSPNYHYSMARTWQYDATNPSRSEDPTRKGGFGGTMARYKNPNQYALFCDAGAGMNVSTSWHTGNNYLLNYAMTPVHLGRSFNFGMAGGNVVNMTAAEVVSYYPVARSVPEFVFNVPR